MLLLYALSVVIFFIIAAFLVPLRVTAQYDGTFEMYVKYLFIKIKVFPSEKKADKEKKPKKEKKADKSEDESGKKEKPKEKKENIFLKFYNNQGFEATLQLIADALKATGGIFSGTFRHFVFREIFLMMRISGPDAAQTAIRYGQISSAVFPAMGYICSKAKVKKYDIDLIPDFLANHDEAVFRFEFGLSPIFVTNSVVAAAFKLFKNVIYKLLKVNSADNKDKKNLEKQVKKAIRRDNL